MDELGLKLKFAAELLRHDDNAVKAAFAAMPNDPGMALQVANKWITDPTVLVEKERLLSTPGSRSFLPSKEKQLKDIYALTADARASVEDRIKAHRLYAEISGFIEKPAAGGFSILNQGVMVVTDHGKDAAWEAKAIEQQQRLITNGNPIN